MAKRVLLTPRARRDLIDIWLAIAERNEPAADAFLDRVGDILSLLGDNPLMGRARPELHQGLRSFPLGNYVLFYRTVPAGIDLVRVLHGHRDIRADDMA